MCSLVLTLWRILGEYYKFISAGGHCGTTAAWMKATAERAERIRVLNCVLKD